MNYIVFGIVVLCFSLVVKLLYDNNKIKEEKDVIQYKYDDLYKQYMFLFDQIYDSSYEEFEDHYTVKFKVKEKLRDLIIAKDSEVKVNYKILN